MNNKLTPVLSVSITNFKRSNNTLRGGFFLLEAALSLLLCIALSGVLFQYKTFSIQLHSTQKMRIKNLYDTECAAYGAITTQSGIVGIRITNTPGRNLMLYRPSELDSAKQSQLLGFAQ